MGQEWTLNSEAPDHFVVQTDTNNCGPIMLLTLLYLTNGIQPNFALEEARKYRKILQEAFLTDDKQKIREPLRDAMEHFVQSAEDIKENNDIESIGSSSALSPEQVESNLESLSNTDIEVLTGINETPGQSLLVKLTKAIEKANCSVTHIYAIRGKMRPRDMKNAEAWKKCCMHLQACEAVMEEIKDSEEADAIKNMVSYSQNLKLFNALIKICDLIPTCQEDSLSALKQRQEGIGMQKVPQEAWIVDQPLFTQETPLTASHYRGKDELHDDLYDALKDLGNEPMDFLDAPGAAIEHNFCTGYFNVAEKDALNSKLCDNVYSLIREEASAWTPLDNEPERSLSCIGYHPSSGLRIDVHYEYIVKNLAKRMREMCDSTDQEAFVFNVEAFCAIDYRFKYLTWCMQNHPFVRSVFKGKAVSEHDEGKEEAQVMQEVVLKQEIVYIEPNNAETNKRTAADSFWHNDPSDKAARVIYVFLSDVCGKNAGNVEVFEASHLQTSPVMLDLYEACDNKELEDIWSSRVFVGRIGGIIAMHGNVVMRYKRNTTSQPAVFWKYTLKQQKKRGRKQKDDEMQKREEAAWKHMQSMARRKEEIWRLNLPAFQEWCREKTSKNPYGMADEVAFPDSLLWLYPPTNKHIRTTIHAQEQKAAEEREKLERVREWKRMLNDRVFVEYLLL